MSDRPTSNNADEWALWFFEHAGHGASYLGVQIAEAMDEHVARTPSPATGDAAGPVVVYIQDREDGGVRVWSDQLPGLILSGQDRIAVSKDIIPAIDVLVRLGGRRAAPPPAASAEAVPCDMADLTAHLLRIKNRLDTIFNNVLCDMSPGYDDSIEGFNKAWDVARDIFQEEIGRAAQKALAAPPPSPDTQDVRWAVNYLLEQLAKDFEAYDTYDIWRSEAAARVRSYKHKDVPTPDAQALREALEAILPPTHGIHGGPLVGMRALYEDGTDEDSARHRGWIRHEAITKARATLSLRSGE